MPSLIPSAIIGGFVLLCILAGLAYARKAGKDAVKLQMERDDAEAQRREWDIERRARNAVDHVRDDAASVQSDSHNRDRKKPAV